jgi:hypothetical protein
MPDPSKASIAASAHAALLAQNALLDQVFGLASHARKAQPWLWSAEARAQFEHVMGPDWPERGSEAGKRFHSEVTFAAAKNFMLAGAHAFAFSAQDAATLAPALRAMAVEKPERFVPFFNTAIESVARAFGCLGQREACSAALPVLLESVAVAPQERLQRLAARIMPPWQLRAPWGDKDASACLAVYGAFVARGCQLSDFLPGAPKPGQTQSEALKAKIDAFAPGGLRDFFLAQWEKSSLENLGRPSAWDAQELSVSDKQELLILITELDRALPGQGARAAIEWLRQHPALPAAATPAKAPPKRSRTGL